MPRMFRTLACVFLLAGCSVPLEGNHAGRVRPDIGIDSRGPEGRALPFTGRTQQPGDSTAPGGTGDLSDSGITDRSTRSIP
jgi:hypothetical protein